MRNPKSIPGSPEGGSEVPRQAAAMTPGGASGVPQIASEVRAETPAAVQKEQPKVRRYRVLNGGTIVDKGMRMTLRAGKELDERTYDVATLKRQGIRLEELRDDEEPQAQIG